MRFSAAILLALILALAPGVGYAASGSKASKAAPGAETPAAEAGVEGKHAAPADAHGDGEGGLPQLQVHTYPSQIFWLLVTFAFLYVAFSKSILPMIGSVVEGRESHIRQNLEEAQRMKDKAQAIHDSYEKSLDSAKFQAAQAVQEVETAVKKKASDQVEAFRKKSEGEIKAAEDRVVAVKNKALGDLNDVAAEVATAAAEKIAGVSADVQKARAIVDGISSKAKAA